VVREPLRRRESSTQASKEWTVRRVLEWTTGYLRRGGIPAARFEAELLLAHALRRERLELYLRPDRTLTPEERARFRELIRKRRAGTPLAYLLGTVEFMNTTLKVNSAVLIPRPETEELVERILRDLEGRPSPGRALDLGTGSGAIAIALAAARPELHVLAVDLSLEALVLARENARLNGVEGRVAFVCSDWFSALRGRFHLIVSNPPYIPTERLEALPKEVRAYEPRKALDGGPRGIRELERIIREAPRFLQPQGRLYLEIGADQAQQVKAALEQTAAFSSVEIFRDLAGKERVVRAVRR